MFDTQISAARAEALATVRLHGLNCRIVRVYRTMTTGLSLLQHQA